MSINRRDLIARVAAGGAIMTLPGFLTGCGLQQVIGSTPAEPEHPLSDWFGVDEPGIARLMSALTANGADIADIYFQHSRSNTLVLRDGVLETADTNVQQGVGLRVVRDGITGYAFTEDLVPESMLDAARTAAGIASGRQGVVAQSFQPLASGDLYTTLVPWSDVGVEQKLPLLQFIEQGVKAKNTAIEAVEVHWADADERIVIATLDGGLVSDHRPMARVTVVATARSGDVVQSGFSNIAARAGLPWFTEDRLKGLIDEVVDRTMIQFDAVRAPSGEMPVILGAGASGVLLHEAIGHSLEADFNREGDSVYAGRIGEQIAGPELTIVDQANIPGEPGALNFDDEGTRTGRTVLVENGILKSYLHDKLSARHFGLESTGSGRRESYRHVPMPRMSCTFLENGPHGRDEIIAAVDKGIYCETYTNGRVEIGAGEFSFKVSNGWLVERGKLAVPIKDVNIIGNGPEMLQRIAMIGNDMQLDAGGWTCGKKGQRVPVSEGIPTVLVSTMTVADEHSG